MQAAAQVILTTWRACGLPDGLQHLCNVRGAGESRGSLDGITVHDLAADVAGVLEAALWLQVYDISIVGS
jgi:hypothetical protein